MIFWSPPPLLFPPARSGAPPFRFLSIFKWEARKGWDVLLQAYLSEFEHGERVELVIKVGLPFLYRAALSVLRLSPPPTPAPPHPRSWQTRHTHLLPTAQPPLISFPRHPPTHPKQTRPFHSSSDFDSLIDASASRLGLPPRHRRPPLRILDRDIPLSELPKLYAAADVFVLPSRGEGCALPPTNVFELPTPRLPPLGVHAPSAPSPALRTVYSHCALAPTPHRPPWTLFLTLSPRCPPLSQLGAAVIHPSPSSPLLCSQLGQTAL